MKLTVVTVKQSTSVNLNHVQMNRKDMPGIANVIRIKLQNTVGKYIKILAETEESC